MGKARTALSFQHVQQRLDAEHIPVGGRGDGWPPHGAAVADEDVRAARPARLRIRRAVAHHHQRRIAVLRLVHGRRCEQMRARMRSAAFASAGGDGMSALPALYASAPVGPCKPAVQLLPRC